MTTRALTHRLKPFCTFLTGQKLHWWVIRRTALTWHPMTSFYSRTSRKKCVVNDFRVQAFKNHVLEASQSEWKKCFDNAKVYKSGWRILWKTIKEFLMINIPIFIIRPEIYIAAYVQRAVSNKHTIELYEVVRFLVRSKIVQNDSYNERCTKKSCSLHTPKGYPSLPSDFKKMLSKIFSRPSKHPVWISLKSRHFQV